VRCCKGKRTILLGILNELFFESMPNAQLPKIQNCRRYLLHDASNRSATALAMSSSSASRLTHSNRSRERKAPLLINAFVRLPDHCHCLWTLPQNDSDLSTRLRCIKTDVTRHDGTDLELTLDLSASRLKRQERNLWQRRFWEHLIRVRSPILYGALLISKRTILLSAITIA